MLRDVALKKTPDPFSRLPEEEADAFEAFLLSLTDERVRFQKVPFDHPQLFIPNGSNDSRGLDENRMMEVVAVGRNGGAPQKKFLEP